MPERRATDGGADPLEERVWEVGWDGHDAAQRRRFAHLTLADKLDWLEEAQVLVRHLERSRGGDVG